MFPLPCNGSTPSRKLVCRPGVYMGIRCHPSALPMSYEYALLAQPLKYCEFSCYCAEQNQASFNINFQIIGVVMLVHQVQHSFLFDCFHVLSAKE